MASFLLGFLGGIVAWVCSSLLGRPLYRFFSLRQEAARVLALFDYAARFSIDDDYSSNAGPLRKQAAKDCGAQLLALAAAHVAVTTLLHKLRFYPQSAGEELLTLSMDRPGSRGAVCRKELIMAALRLGDARLDPGQGVPDCPA
ncbi:MAG TPA: hypothetical protein VHG92_12400 [Afifellaceae bacterium]|nr:hypothetical protein [Afifellaceae bacterium]